MKRFVLMICAVMIFALSLPAGAEVIPSPMFGDHMVLQQGMRVPVWGQAEDGELVTVEFQNQSVSTVALDGQWIVYLDSLSPGQPSEMVITGNGSSIVFTDVQVGQVWVCSGQSNMVWQLSQADNAEEAIADSGNYNIRLFLLPGIATVDDAVWQVCDPVTSPSSSAVAFFFARDLAKNLNVPIGLIEAPKGATGIKHWTPTRDGILYDSKIAPMQPYAIAGAIWYQGEWDAQSECTATDYYDIFPELIDCWRTDWGQGDFPFLFVQLPKFETSNRIPGWMIVRDAQLATLSVENTAMACIIDVDVIPITNIHPTCKEPVGVRLALGALKVAYDRDIVHSGPIYNHEKSYISGDEFIAGFDFTGRGLTADTEEMPGFEIAAEDGIYVPAQARISTNRKSVIVSSPLLQAQPCNVRYSWDDDPLGNLFNSEELPASPFITERLPQPPRHRPQD